MRQLGTLGGGNHFIEVCLDEAERVWVMLHSGSRGIGNAIGRYFIALAQQEMRAPDDRTCRTATWPTSAKAREHFDDYVEAVGWAQDYARANRARDDGPGAGGAARATCRRSTSTAKRSTATTTTSSARSTSARRLASRARARSARAQGELGIIPGSMGARSYIVRGKGNAGELSLLRPRRRPAHEPHRRRSKQFSIARPGEPDRRASCAARTSGVLDEIPGAYKDIDEVMANQTDLVEVVHTLKQVLCVKG